MALVGILSTLDNPLLPGYIACLEAEGILDYAVICDSRILSRNQQDLLFKRLGGWSIADHFDYCLKKDAYMTPFHFVDNHNSTNSFSLINKLGCSLLLNAGTPRKLNSTILNATKYGVLNVHPGELPSYRGQNCPEWAVYHGSRVVVTAHMMTVDYDEGDVLGMAEVEWRELKSYVEFRRQVYLNSFTLAARVSLSLLSNRHEILFNSASLSRGHQVHPVMPDEILEIVKARFPCHDS